MLSVHIEIWCAKLVMHFELPSTNESLHRKLLHDPLAATLCKGHCRKVLLHPHFILSQNPRDNHTGNGIY